MSHVHEGPLATYNSLTDGHLAGYFANSHMRRHLRKAGLVSKRGEIVSESTYRLNMSRKEHKKHVKDMLAQAIVHKTLDLERSRQAEIKKKLEEIAKIQLVRRVRNERTQLLEETLLPLLSPRSSRRARTPSPRHLKNKGGTKSQSLSSIPARNDRAMTSRRGDEDVLPLLSPRSGRRGSSPSFKAKGRSSHSKHRPYSAPGVRAESRLSQMSIEEDGDVLYLDDEGHPITPARLDNADDNHIDTRHLHSLDTTALRKYAMLMAQMEEGRGLNSPYMMPQVPLPPKTPLSNRTPRSARRVQSASPRRPVTTDARIARLHRPETAKPHVGDQQMMCRVLMKYHGWALKLAREKMDPTQEVVIEQQHCGGNTLTVFKERLLPGTNFEFISYRHRGYPFSLTLYLDGQMDSRVSTCCEYRHSRGAKIGGKQGHFSLLRVDGAIPCYKCQVAKGVLLRSKAPPKKPKRPSERHMEEVIVVSTKKDHDDGTQDTGADQRVEQARPTEDEDQAVVVAVERDDLDGDDTKLKSPAKTETSYADDFEDSHSSASSKKSSGSSSSSSSSSSDSESETETSARKDEDYTCSGVRNQERGKEQPEGDALPREHRKLSSKPRLKSASQGRASKRAKGENQSPERAPYTDTVTPCHSRSSSARSSSSSATSSSSSSSSTSGSSVASDKPKPKKKSEKSPKKSKEDAPEQDRKPTTSSSVVAEATNKPETKAADAKKKGEKPNDRAEGNDRKTKGEKQPMQPQEEAPDTADEVSDIESEVVSPRRLDVSIPLDAVPVLAAGSTGSPRSLKSAAGSPRSPRRQPQEHSTLPDVLEENLQERQLLQEEEDATKDSAPPSRGEEVPRNANSSPSLDDSRGNVDAADSTYFRTPPHQQHGSTRRKGTWSESRTLKTHNQPTAPRTLRTPRTPTAPLTPHSPHAVKGMELSESSSSSSSSSTDDDSSYASSSSSGRSHSETYSKVAQEDERACMYEETPEGGSDGYTLNSRMRKEKIIKRPRTKRSCFSARSNEEVRNKALPAANNVVEVERPMKIPQISMAVPPNYDTPRGKEQLEMLEGTEPSSTDFLQDKIYILQGTDTAAGTEDTQGNKDSKKAVENPASQDEAPGGKEDAAMKYPHVEDVGLQRPSDSPAREDDTLDTSENRDTEPGHVGEMPTIVISPFPVPKQAMATVTSEAEAETEADSEAHERGGDGNEEHSLVFDEAPETAKKEVKTDEAEDATPTNPTEKPEPTIDIDIVCSAPDSPAASNNTEGANADISISRVRRLSAELGIEAESIVLAQLQRQPADAGNQAPTPRRRNLSAGSADSGGEESVVSESKSKSTEEKFSLIEPRGEEREEAATPTPRPVDQEERDAGDRSARSPRSPRSPRTPRTPRVEVNGTGREIDDYSSDDDDDNDKKNKVISMEGVEAETKPIRRHRSVSSSSDNSNGRQQRRGQTNAIVSVDLLDKEEREQENARKNKAKRDELQRQETDELLQRQRRETAQRREEERRAEEARRQEDRYEQQQREEARRRREEQRRLEAEQERQQRDEQEESRRRALLIEQDAQAREEERLRAQRLREEQIMEEQRQREARRREEERVREERWQEEQARREDHRRKEEEERAERKRQLEEGSSSARTESSTARTSSSEASSSSEESTPRRTGQSELTAHGERERERAASPLPPAAVYEDRRQLRGDAAPPPQRPVSPLPPAAVYQERPKRRQETVTAASTQLVPEAAVYRERPRFPATEEPAPIIGLDAQPPSPDEPRKQHTARSSSSATQDSSSSSEEEEEKEEARFQVDQQEYPRFRVLSTRFTDTVAKKPEEDDEASHPNLRYQSKRSDEVSDSEEEEAGAARYQRNQQASKHAEDEDSGTADSSSDSTSSSGSDSDRSITMDSAADSQHVQDTTEADVSGKNPDSHVRTTSESDGENMHGGADPDNVAQQETVGELLPLRTRELPAAKSHDGKVSELLTSRESVELSNVLLNKTQVYEVASHLEQADTVKMISLCNTGLDDDDMQRLTEAITASPSEPVMLNLSLNALTQKSVKHVLNVLKAKPSIKLLILQSNPVGDKGAEELVQGLQDLHRQARANRHAAATTATADSNTADTLSMDSSASSNIDPVTASRRYLLQELDLTDTGLGDKGAEHVAQLLANNVYVESLGLSHNSHISAQDGWSRIGEALAKNRCLRTLSLDGNRLGDEGVEHLAHGLRTNRALRSLTLEDAGVSVEGGKRLMEMLKRNTTLLELTLLPGNSIPDELAEDIKKYIALNRAPYDNFGV